MSSFERFVDAGYWIALVNVRDEFHARARALASALRGPLVTTDAVLLEVGDALARLATRRFAVTLLQEIDAAHGIEVIPLNRSLYHRAFDLYAARLDKEWGLTDCISFVVMRDRGIPEALAADRHFVQAGFRALLREA
jgi:predicted nucleic acid-binding protein